MNSENLVFADVQDEVLDRYNIKYNRKTKSMIYLNKNIDIEVLVECCRELKVSSYSFKLEEIYSSMKIENNSLSKWETASVLDGNIIDDKQKDSLETMNLVHATNTFNNYPITEEIIKAIHLLICVSTHSGNELLDYRKENVYIEGSSFVPQGWESVSESIKELVEIYNKDIDILDALKFKLSFVTINPFIDGNRRTSRLLLNSILSNIGYGRLVINPRDKYLYCQALENAQVNGEFDEYLRFMLNAYIKQYYSIAMFKQELE
ncbi:Fic family protein [uncultured Clostridium sp.]|uniref:Fic family protein n=1 Tax=uncultured Clostridium sp. TaxID=59620 RepID=UPI0026319BC5|nr:Fic family protein [uncultured Clostridium sp.]